MKDRMVITKEEQAALLLFAGENTLKIGRLKLWWIIAFRKPRYSIYCMLKGHKIHLIWYKGTPYVAYVEEV